MQTTECGLSAPVSPNDLKERNAETVRALQTTFRHNPNWQRWKMHESKRKVLLSLAVPLLLAGACAHDEASDGTLQVLDSDAISGLAAEYSVGPDLVRIATRRIVTEVAESDGNRTTRFIEVDGTASQFQVEVTLVDVNRDVQAIWRGDRPELQSRAGTSDADLQQSIALFTDALYSLAATDEPIAIEERDALTAFADGASQPGASDPIDSPTPEDSTEGCAGFAFPPTFSVTSVFGTGKITCLQGGKYKGAVCIINERHPLWWNYPVESGCNESSEQEFQDPTAGGTVTLEMTSADDRADVWCGDLGADYTYQTKVKMVEGHNLWFWQDWKDMGVSTLASHKCGKG
jgi:hypothetical protein